MIRIDAHVHLGATWQGRDHNRVTAEDVIRLYDQYGFSMGCLSSWEIGYDFDHGNEETVKVAKQFPDRFIPLVIVAPRYGQEAVDTIKKYREEYGFRGVKIHPSTNRFRVDNAWVMDPIMEACETYGMYLQCHSEADQYCHPRMIHDLGKRFPNVNILLAHFGENMSNAWLDAVYAVRDTKNIYLDTTATPNEVFIIPTAIKACGADRIVFGSDLPIYNFKVELDKVLYADLQGHKVTQHEKDMLLGGTMAKILGIPA